MSRLISLLLLPVTLSAQLKRFQFSQNKMGSLFSIIFYCEDSAKATELSTQCFDLVDSINNVFSDYSTSSEVGRLASMQIIKNQSVSNELFQMILRSRQAWLKSGKSFDITVGALTQLWRKAKDERRFPSYNEVTKAKQSTSFGNLIINEKAKTISFKKQGMMFDFGGIVPGYAAQKVIDFLRRKNINIALADASGDIVMSEAPPGKSGWVVGINLPESENELWDRKLELKNCAVSTSGDVYRYTIHNGKKYSHIIDPRSGYGVTSQRNVTVIAKDGAVADWLATACSILSIEKALALARKENAALFIATLKGDKVVTYKTENFDRFFQ
jgi:thiamine biosynthesis lipoprotein